MSSSMFSLPSGLSGNATYKTTYLVVKYTPAGTEAEQEPGTKTEPKPEE